MYLPCMPKFIHILMLYTILWSCGVVHLMSIRRCSQTTTTFLLYFFVASLYKWLSFVFPNDYTLYYYIPLGYRQYTSNTRPVPKKLPRLNDNKTMNKKSECQTFYQLVVLHICFIIVCRTPTFNFSLLLIHSHPFQLLTDTQRIRHVADYDEMAKFIWILCAIFQHKHKAKHIVWLKRH